MEIRSNPETKDQRQFDLEERSFLFAKDVACYCKRLPNTTANIEYMRQVIRSSGSVGSNYIEANEALGKKDFTMRLRISRKEAKESAYWLHLIAETNPEPYVEEGKRLQNEATALKKIFSAIIKKLTQSVP